jgi:hypothetical protein
MPVGKARLRYVVYRASGTFAESSMEKGGLAAPFPFWLYFSTFS